MGHPLVFHEIPSCRIFPKVDSPVSATAELVRMTAMSRGHSNYASTAEYAEEFEAEIDRLEALGAVQVFESWTEIRASLGDVILSKG